MSSLEVPHQGSLPDGAVSPPQALRIAHHGSSCGTFPRFFLFLHNFKMLMTSRAWSKNPCHAMLYAWEPGSRPHTGPARFRFGVAPGAEAKVGSGPELRTREQQKASGKTWRRGWLSNLQVDHGATTPVSLP